MTGLLVIYDEYKKPCKMIGAMQDISKLKENEISLSELNENLQKQTKELSISNEELDEQNRILQDNCLDTIAYSKGSLGKNVWYCRYY